MAKCLAIVLLSIHLIAALDEREGQQIQTKVKRINLKDYGITKDNYTQREVEPTQHRGTADRPFHRLDPFVERPKDIDFSERYGRREERTEQRTRTRDRFDLTNRRVDRFNRRSTERELSSPLDWSATVNRFEATLDEKVPTDAVSPSNGTILVGPYDQIDRGEQPFRGYDLNKDFKPFKNCSADCVEEKYLKHYFAKGCLAIADAECNCTVGFQCPPEMVTNSTVCRYDGRTYRIGARIPVRNPCRICECRDVGRRLGKVLAQIDCGIGIECPEEAFGVKPEPNCYFGYERDQCCGRQICKNSLEPKRAQKVCTYRNRQYKFGQKIYPEEDDCLTCHCDDDWDDRHPLNTTSCVRHRCDFELDKDYQNGCLPIYHEGTCCPIEYMCPKTFPTRPEVKRPDQCYFDGQSYPIGATLRSGNVCVDCQCKVPPDFTCVHRSCPTPPHNCFVGKWDNSVCCQKYICSRADRIRDESQFRQNFYSN